MKRMIVFAFLLLTAITGFAQDYIINWNNDTLPCKLPASAKEAGLRPRWRYENGYDSIVAVFGNDSDRVIKAGEIKGYTRTRHGKALLCDGFFEAKQISDPPIKQGRNGKGKTASEKNWVFVSRLVRGKYASLYRAYEYHGSATCAIYYVGWENNTTQTDTIVPVYTRRQMIRLFIGDDAAGSIRNFRYRRTGKGFYDIIHEYNRLKEMEDKMQP